MAFLSLYSSSKQSTPKQSSSSSQTATTTTTLTTTTATISPTIKQRPEKLLPARPPLAQLFNADTTSVSMNTDEQIDSTTEDDRRRSLRRRSSRADALSRRGSLTTSLHSSSPHKSFPDENFPSTSASAALYENLATFTFGSQSQRDVIAPFADQEPEDDEERVRSERAKMRAIDDGTRRPSLPSNIPENSTILSDRRPSQPINIPRPPQPSQQTQSPANTAPNSFDTWPVGSWSHEATPSPPFTAHPEQEEASALAGFDLDFIMAPPTNLNDPCNSIPQSHDNNHPQSTFLSTFTAFGQSAAAGRRPSNVSTISDQNDTFFRHIRKNDVEYTDRRKQWSFKRRTLGTPKDRAGNPSQMWECAIAGKFIVSRCRSTRENLDGKPQPSRLLIRPYDLPQLHAIRPHPSVIIHKHSRAHAFSIFRSSRLRTSHMNASRCVLLAPLKVQVHYTETRSTRALKTYNFLNDKEDSDDRGETSSAADRASDRRVSPAPMDITEVGPPSVINQQPIAGPSSLRITPQVPSLSIPQISQRALISPLPEEEEDDDDTEIDGRIYVRKSHADAFATLDDKQLEAHRLASLTDPVPIPVEVNRVRQSRFGTALKRAFSGAAVPQHSPTSADKTPTADDVGGVFNPPWLTLPPRSLQEKNARTLHQLNKSFEDVGLLPHRRKVGHIARTQDGAGISSRTIAINNKSRSLQSNLHGEAFEVVPDESPVMLLPMWPNEANMIEDAKGKGGNAPRTTSIPIHERRYLLIYYVPFSHGDGASPSSRDVRNGKKRARPSTGNSYDLQRTSSDTDKHQGDYLTAFRVVAKVLSYDDVRTSGLRLPNEGIEISPILPSSLPDSTFTVPPILSNFGDTMVIAICPSPESTIEFVPEGLDKLGLCYRPGDLPISSIAEPTESERLSPVGKAIVEMAWVGCLSVMGLASTL